MRRAGAGLAALALACAMPGAPLPIPPHLEALRPEGAYEDGVSLGVLPVVDVRRAASRVGAEPRASLSLRGYLREGEEQTGDADFSEPVGPAVRRAAIATLLRSGAFERVEPVADPATARGFDLLLAVTLEQFVGTRFRSTSLDLLQLGWYRSRVDDPVGIARLRYRLYRRGELVWDERIETWRQAPAESIERAALDALAITNEKAAHQLYRELVPPAPDLRELPLRVLDGCALGAKTVARQVADAGEILEREARLRPVPRIETWRPPAIPATPAMLEHVRGLEPPAGGVVVAFVPAGEPRAGISLRRDSGLARQLGRHALVVCRPDAPIHPTTLAHELAHLFGAVHVRDRASLMNARADFDARFLDPLNRRVLHETRTRPFGRPLPEPMRRSLEALYRSAPRDVVVPNDLDRALLALGSR